MIYLSYSYGKVSKKITNFTKTKNTVIVETHVTITLTKEAHKPSILRCTRSDGSSTFAKLHPNLEIHDIAHYVVEKHLGFTKAFYGLLAQGYDIGDFQLPKADRPVALHPNNLDHEALITEHLVNLIQTHFGTEYPSSNIISMLKDILEQQELPFPKQLTVASLTTIRHNVKELMEQWYGLDDGEVLQLEFKNIYHL